MLRNFISSLSEGKYGKVIKEFNPAKLSETDRSSLSFQVNEKGGQYILTLVLQEDEGHEIEREFCNVDVTCLDDIERLIADVKTYIKDTGGPNV
jgi:hypothetical protein